MTLIVWTLSTGLLNRWDTLLVRLSTWPNSVNSIWTLVTLLIVGVFDGGILYECFAISADSTFLRTQQYLGALCSWHSISYWLNVSRFPCRRLQKRQCSTIISSSFITLAHAHILPTRQFLQVECPYRRLLKAALQYPQRHHQKIKWTIIRYRARSFALI